MATELAPGATFAGYRLESLIGRTAMAEVYRARDAGGRDVALKLLESGIANDERFRRRFLRESELAAGLHHPHVVATLGSGEDDGRLFLAMELVDGTDLRRLLRDEGRLDARRTVALVEQAAGALDAAHAAGLVHRDVKPGNILVRRDADGEHAYVCDFGLARHVTSASSLTGDRGFVGTVDYVPPEQIEGGTVDARADVYSLGCVLYECLAGVRPFDRDSELAVVFAHLNEPPPKLTDARPDLPAAFDDVVATALAKSPDARYSSCGELAAAARAALRGRVLARRRPRRRRLLAVGVGVVLAAVAAALAFVLTRSSDAAPVTITPTSIGGARLGDTDVTLERLWGGSYRQATLDQPANYSALTYSGRALSAYFVGTSLNTVEVATSNSGDRTAEGIGPCSTVDDLKKAYGDRLKPNPHMSHNGVVFGWTLGKHLMFVMGPVPVPTRVEAVALFSNDLASAGYLAGGPCVAGQANVVERPAAARVAATPALTQTFAATRFNPRLSVRAPKGWTKKADRVDVFALNGPHSPTSIEFRLDPSAASARGAPLTGVSRTASGLSAWLRAMRAVGAGPPQSSRLGRPVLTVTSLDVGAASHALPYLTFREHGPAATIATGKDRARVYLTPVRIGALVHTLAIVVRSPTAATDTIVRSLHVQAAPVHEITALSAQCTQPFGGTCLGEIRPGTHTTRSFRPALTYTVPVDWTNYNDHVGNLDLAPPGGDWEAVDSLRSDHLGVYQRIAPTGSRCGDDAAPVRDAAAYVRWLANNPGLVVTPPKRVTVGGLSGYLVDVRIRPSWTRTCPWSHGDPAVQFMRGIDPTFPEMIHATSPGYVMRLYLLDYKRATLGIEIDEVGGSEKLDDYSAIVKTFRFATG